MTAVGKLVVAKGEGWIVVVIVVSVQLGPKLSAVESSSYPVSSALSGYPWISRMVSSPGEAFKT